MSVRNTSPEFPWAGVTALGAAAVVTGVLLGGIAAPAQMLNTWYLTRAAGLVSFWLLWLSVILGLLQATGSLKGVTSPLANIDLHNFVSLAALYTGLFHGLILLFDHYMPFTLAQILIPFASAEKPLLVGLGGVGFYIALLAIVTTIFRERLKPKVWRGIHQASLAGFVFVLLHGWLMGTDRAQPLVAYGYRFAAISVAVLLGYRVFKGVANHAHSARRG